MRFSLFASFALGLSLSGALLFSASRTAPLALVSTPIYSDALSSGWENWSWDTTLQFAASTRYAGTSAIAVTHTRAWSGLYLHHSGVSLSNIQTLEFWIHGGTSGGQKIAVYAEDSAGGGRKQIEIAPYLAGATSITANKWVQCRIPTRILGLGTSPLTGLIFQEFKGTAQPTYYLDNIQLSGDTSVPVPTPTPFVIPPFGDKSPPWILPTAPTGTSPASLGNQFLLGLANAPDRTDWMRANAGAWRVRYQYLTGGATSPNNWTKWNPPDGQFATYYLNDSANLGVIPCFTYYNLLPSEPQPYNETPSGYRAKFDSAATMRAYFSDFKLLMQKCAAANKPVIVHVEPDLWGYIQHANSNPALYPAQIGSSGLSELAGLPNNAVGFARAFVTLQKRYAPNVVLALHASMWSSGIDVSLNRSSSLNIRPEAGKTGAFLNALGDGWPLIFVDFADRDAAYRQLVSGSQIHWWDETDRALPNFAQAHFYLSCLNQATKRRLVVWQVPIGNTKMRSCNNTPGHYQDNRVQYYLGQDNTTNLQKLAKSGVVGLFFGRGDGNTTTNTDERGDGITNPAPINNNTGVASVSDDDGGYLRARGLSYRSRILAIPPAATPTPVPTTTPRPVTSAAIS